MKTGKNLNLVILNADHTGSADGFIIKGLKTLWLATGMKTYLNTNLPAGILCGLPQSSLYRKRARCRGRYSVS